MPRIVYVVKSFAPPRQTCKLHRLWLRLKARVGICPLTGQRCHCAERWSNQRRFARACVRADYPLCK